MNCTIVHKGVVRSITDDTILVVIATQSACGDCHAKNICGFSEISEKIVHIANDKVRMFNIGDEVQLEMASSLGIKAVLMAYIVPLFILVATLFIAMHFTNDLIAAMLAIVITTCYYLFLYKKNRKIERKFSFSIK